MQIITNLDAIKDLRRKLKEVLEDLRFQYDKTGKAIDTVAETWKDKNFLSFKEKFLEDQDKLKPLCDSIEAYDLEVLQILEQRIEQYLG